MAPKTNTKIEAPEAGRLRVHIASASRRQRVQSRGHYDVSAGEWEGLVRALDLHIVWATALMRIARSFDRYICTSCLSLVPSLWPSDTLLNGQPLALCSRAALRGVQGFSLCWSNDFGTNSCWEGAARNRLRVQGFRSPAMATGLGLKLRVSD